MQEFPGIKFAEMGTILGERWRALTPEQKKRYEDMAAEDKVRFHVEMQKYTGRLNQIEAQAQENAEAQARAQAVAMQQQQQFDPNQQVQQQQVQSYDPNTQVQQQYDPQHYHA